MPFARALSLLAAFAPEDRMLGTRRLSVRTGLPPSTVTRIAQSLVTLGYLRYERSVRKYRLAAPVLALGYGANVDRGVQEAARCHMTRFADRYKVHVKLSSRDQLALVIRESCSSPHAPLAPDLHVGLRLELASSPLGWALLAALPEPEREYLLERAERQCVREWSRLRRRSIAAIAQVREIGVCSSLGDWAEELAIVAAPVVVEGGPPLVVACVGATAAVGRLRVERELGPQLVALANTIRRRDAVT
jgi:DNA-binding IclR family transcriptional regulator